MKQAETCTLLIMLLLSLAASPYIMAKTLRYKINRREWKWGPKSHLKTVTMLPCCFSSNDYCVYWQIYGMYLTYYLQVSPVGCMVENKKVAVFYTLQSGVSNLNQTQASPIIKTSCQAICPFEQHNFNCLKSNTSKNPTYLLLFLLL